jgi:pimeloyl-ACP methyl ester carboxylesterase
LRAYTTERFVADIEAARSALGYEQISLWGASYGTRAAFVYAKRHPQRVRSLVLVAPAPMSMPILDSFEEDGRAALDALVADCLSDTTCERAFPGLRADVQKVCQKLADPFHRLGLQLLQYSSATSRLLPLLISLAADGRSQPLELAIEGQRAQLLSLLSIGLHLAVFCNEDVPFPETDASHSPARSLLRGEYERACLGWPRAALPEDFRAAVRVDKPALVISGEWDPVTSPRWARAAGDQFSRSQIVVVPKSGHLLGGIASCIGAMAADFLDTGRADTSCVARVKRPPYAIVPER